MSTVICSRCGTPSPAGKKFCAECGAALSLVCPSCGEPVTAGQKFCAECGAGLSAGSAVAVQTSDDAGITSEATSSTSTSSSVRPATARPPAEQIEPPSEERRLVTALFCDLVGFTPLSESLDPEEVRDIQAEYFDAMSAQIDRYGGMVEKYAGDAVLALFGTPIAHEDDAERALLCALGMQAAIEPVAARARLQWNVEPSIRVGVNTGEVVSGTWNASGRQDMAVTGDAVNTAARIQAAADPGEVLAGTETMRLTRRRIRFGERRDLVLKGKAGTVPSYPALGLREQFGERWETSEQATPLAGRDREMLELLDLWIRAQGGDGQLVTLIGDAGVGKSRLISEVLEKVGTSIAIRVLRARCLSYGQEISLWLIADLLRSFFGIGEQDALDVVRGKLTTATTSLLAEPGPEIQAEAMDVLGEVLGLPAGNSLVSNAGAQIRRQALIRDIRLLLSALSERAPTILVVEDLHWIDDASADVLIEVLSDIPGLRVLALAAQRPGWTAPWSDWGWTERLSLRPLRDDEATLLAEAVLGGMKLSGELEQYVADRAGGNPFFVEEMLRALQETGGIERRNGQMVLVPGAAERLPSTLTEVLLARLDRLEGQVRSVAQVASVIGRSFAVKLLAQVVGWETVALETPLTALQRAEIAFPRRGSDVEYVFKHVSMREVAYNTLVHRRRQELHLATARAIAELYPSDEYVEMIAYHYGHTEEHAEAARWLERAGDRAAGIYANEAAIGQYREARRRLALSSGDETALARLDEKIGAVLATVGQYDEALELFDRAVEIYRQAKNLEAVGRITARMGRVHRIKGTIEEGIARLQPILDVLAWSGPSRGLALLHVALAHLLFANGRYRECLEAAQAASELARAVGDNAILAAAEMRRAAALELLGESRAGMQAMEEAIPLAEGAGDLDTLSILANNLGESYFRAGALEQGRASLERALELAERVGELASTAYTMVTLGEALLYIGDWEEARHRIERGAEMLESVGDSWYAAYPLLHLGHLDLIEGRWQEARGDLDTCITIAERTGDIQALRYAHWLLGRLEIGEGKPEATLARLEPLASTEGPYILALLATLAEANLEMGAVERADELVQRALAYPQGKDRLLELVQVHRVYGMTLTRQGRYGEAEAVFDEALSVARSMQYPYAEAGVLCALSRLLLQEGEQDRSERCLEEALTIFRRLGATKDIERTEHALAQSV